MLVFLSLAALHNAVLTQFIAVLAIQYNKIYISVELFEMLQKTYVQKENV